MLARRFSQDRVVEVFFSQMSYKSIYGHKNEVAKLITALGRGIHGTMLAALTLR